MIIAHLSDLHVSRYGGYMASLRGGRRQFASNNNGWEVIWRGDQWRIEMRSASGKARLRDALRLVSPDARIHQLTKIKKSETISDVQGKLVELYENRMATSQANLAAHMPGPERLAAALEADPLNANLRFCAVARAVEAQSPDWVLISGDLTDDAVGYELVVSGLIRWVERGRLVAVPGNHDIYPTPPLWTSGALRKSIDDKRNIWAAFAASIGLTPSGSFVHDLGEGVAVACFDSCHPPKTPGSASGLVPEAHLRDVRESLADRKPSKGNLAMLHHHIINLPYDGGAVAPFQPGMRLRNAKSLFNACREMGLAAVLNGHRHVGYKFAFADGPVYVSSPSTTAGCRTGAAPFFWIIDIDEGGINSVRAVPVPMLADLPMRRGPKNAATTSTSP